MKPFNNNFSPKLKKLGRVILAGEPLQVFIGRPSSYRSLPAVQQGCGTGWPVLAGKKGTRQSKRRAMPGQRPVQTALYIDAGAVAFFFLSRKTFWTK